MIQEGDVLSGRVLKMSFPNTLSFTDDTILITSADYTIMSSYVEEEYCTIGLYDSENVLIDAFYTYDPVTQTAILNLPTYTLPNDFGVVETIDSDSPLFQYITAIFGQEIASDTINMANYLDTHNDAAKTATNYLSWISQQEGLVISENPVTDISTITGGNTRINSNGMRIFNGTTKVADFGSTVVLGEKTTTAIYTEIDNDSFDVLRGSESLAHFGYGAKPGGTPGPYASIGSRDDSSYIGNYSVVLGDGNGAGGFASIAMGDYCHADDYCSVAIGTHAHAEGGRSIAIGDSVNAGYSNQIVLGKYNDNQSDTALEVGWGTSSTPKNILELRNNGNLTVTGEVHGTNIPKIASGQVTGVVCPPGTWESTITFSSAFSTIPIVTVSFFSSSTSADFGNCTLSVYNVSENSFTVKMFNDGTASRSPYINWIAVGT